MDDEQNASGNRHRHFEGQDPRDTSENSGPDTVRILPESGHTHDDSDEWYVERPVVRSGTLYTRMPVEPTQTLRRAGQDNPNRLAGSSRDR